MQRNMHPGRRRMETGKHDDRHKEKFVSRKNDSSYSRNLGQTINRPRYREYEKRHEYIRSTNYGRGTFKHAVPKNSVQNIQIRRRGIFPFKRNYEGDIKYSGPRATGIHPIQRQRENSQPSCDRDKAYWIPAKEKYEPINNQRFSTCPDTFQRDYPYQMQQKRWKFSHNFHNKRKFDHADKFKSRKNCAQYVHQQAPKRRPSFNRNRYEIKTEQSCETSLDGTKSDSFNFGTQSKDDLQTMEHAVKGNFQENMVFGDSDEKMLKEEQELLEKNSEEDCFKQDIMENEISKQSGIGNQESSKRDCTKDQPKVCNYSLDLLEDFPLDLQSSKHGHAERLLQQNAVTSNDQNNNKMDQPRHDLRIQKKGIERSYTSEVMANKELQLNRNEDAEIQSATSVVWSTPPQVIVHKSNCTEETVDKYCSTSGVGFSRNSLGYPQEIQRKLDKNSIMHSTHKESIVNDAPRETNELLNNSVPRDPRIRSFNKKYDQTLACSISTSTVSKTQRPYARNVTKRQPVPQRLQMKKSKPKLTINEVMEKHATSVRIFGLAWVMDLLSVDDEALEKRENEVISKAADPSGWCVPHEGLKACQQQRKNLAARRSVFSTFIEESLHSTKRLHMRIPQNHL